MEIGKQIKKYRNMKSMNQDDLSEKIYVSRQTISSWENNKSYPDIHSLILLCQVFDVSLDQLVKGDIEKMKTVIENHDIEGMKKKNTYFTVMMILLVILPVPLLKFLKVMGIVLYILFFVATMYVALQIEKDKKQFDIQTYKEIDAFMKGKTLDEIQKNREIGKRPYQQFLLAVASAFITLIVCGVMFYIFY